VLKALSVTQNPDGTTMLSCKNKKQQNETKTWSECTKNVLLWNLFVTDLKMNTENSRYISCDRDLQATSQHCPQQIKQIIFLAYEAITSYRDLHNL
jgi:hypothetical protein